MIVDKSPASRRKEVGVSRGPSWRIQATSAAVCAASVGVGRALDQNLIFSAGVTVVLVTLGLLGQIGLTAGVIGHEGSTVLVSLNGLRLLAGGRSS
jgi:cation transport ATPase